MPSKSSMPIPGATAPGEPSQQGNHITVVPNDREKRQPSNATQPRSAWHSSSSDRKPATKPNPSRENDNSEQWESELLEMRLEELKDARKLIATRSSVSGEDVERQVQALNEKIIYVAKSVIEISTGWSRGQKDGQVFVGGFLQYPDKVDKGYLADKTFAQAILQVFLARSCMSWIDSWYPGKPALDTYLRSLYDNIRKKEGQTAARKWRQLICERELSHEPDANILSAHAHWITEQLMQTSSRLGEEHRKQVRKGVQDLVDISEKLRRNKAEMISDEFQPWIAWNEGVAYNSPSMKDVSGQFGGKQIQNPGDIVNVRYFVDIIAGVLHSVFVLDRLRLALYYESLLDSHSESFVILVRTHQHESSVQIYIDLRQGLALHRAQAVYGQPPE
ncbi:hypothetical protein AN958_05541 [Leucoagaricus sp. SymC.cos]|nr:hypothetical protein AN958_05541 [Leucoagaricus sp. SymC.cos]